MGRDDHGILRDEKDQWWVECPNSDMRIPEDEQPQFCPHCGEEIGPKRRAMKLPEEVKIEVFTKDDKGEDADYKYCAIVMGWNGEDWYNTGVVIRDPSPIKAFSKAMESAIRRRWWK